MGKPEDWEGRLFTSVHNERVRGISRKAASQMRRVPDCAFVPFGDEVTRSHLTDKGRWKYGGLHRWASIRCSRTRRSGFSLLISDKKAWVQDVSAFARRGPELWSACRRRTIAFRQR